ncbi:hypothetical protein QVD17_32855 [Tagetes erecta]|uniref:Uncharacterized protein n=1 Tax=Tagetes erecta TaxID=13708 RepID=A0AAD8JYT9_TARER|nr:hypothetical protein QVD17_32855 [Tagetes erecta]
MVKSLNFWCNDGSFSLTDTKQNLIIFKIIPVDSVAHRKLKLYNKDGTELLTLQELNGTTHGRWEARGPEQELLYSVCRHHMIQNKLNIDLRVLMKQSRWKCKADIEYRVKGSASSSSFIVYEGDSSTEVAQVNSDASNENKYLVKLVDPYNKQGKKDYDEYLMKIVFSIAVIVDVAGSRSRTRVIAGKVFGGAAKLVTGVALVGGSLLGIDIQG